MFFGFQQLVQTLGSDQAYPSHVQPGGLGLKLIGNPERRLPKLGNLTGQKSN